MLKKIISKYSQTPVSVKASVAYTICNILQRCMSFITLPLFTRILSTEEYGQSSIFSSWLSILTIFISLYLGYGSFNTAMLKFKERRNEYLASANSICVLFAIVFMIIYLPLQKYFNLFFELPTPLIIFMILEIIAGNALQCWNGKMRFEYKYKSVIAVTLSMTVLSPIMSYILILGSDEKGYARIIGNSIVTICFGGFLLFQNWLKEHKIYTKEFWKYALGFNIPLIPYYLSQVIFNQSDRIMIGHMQGTGKAGIYNVAYTLATLLTVVLNAINNAYVPWLYERIKDDDRAKNQKVSCYIAIIMAVLLLAVIIAAPEIIFILAGKKYMDAIWVVPPVAMSLLLLFYSQMFINIEFYFEEKKSLVKGTIWAAVINIVLNALLIPVFGFVAAAYTTLISYIIFTIMHYFAYRKILVRKNIPQDLYDFRSLLIIMFAFLMIGFLMMMFYKLSFIRYIIIFVGAFILFIKRKSILKLLKQIKNRSV